MSRGFNLLLVFWLLCLAAVSIWGLKNISSNVTYSASAFTIVLVHSIVGFLAYIQPSHWNMLRKITHNSSFICEVVVLPLITADLLLIVNCSTRWIVGLFLIAVLPLVAKFHSNYMLGKYILDLAVALNTMLLLHVRLTQHTAHWIEGLIILIPLNHFGISRLSQLYDISCLECGTISLFFITMFSVKSLNEIVN